ncbi:hypothetical protein [Streptomyces arenae]|uniref:hypothetical protein n=1 Tax=Streptomyces arenae TaxID=29301 RepID=UPI002659F98F|nr:hypothetical protein [Streptomyces arenae]MCG7206716.1 hypothetical protein [Streptomyces arenae]
MVRTNSKDADGQADASLMDRNVTYRARNRALLVAVAGLAMTPALVTPATANSARKGAENGTSGKTLTVKSGQTLELTETTTVSELTIADGGAIAAPDGYSLTLTVNGVETGSKLDDLYDNDGIVTHIAAGTYRGDVVIDVAAANTITYNSRSWPIRQAVYVDADGIDRDKSVLSAVLGGRVRDTSATGLQLVSKGESFNGVYVAGGSYELNSPRIKFDGNGRCDFIGYGASVVGTGEGTTLVIDDAHIDNRGVVRTAVIADATATVVVKNSTIKVADGELPSDYQDTGDTSFMMTCPWLLGVYGTVRATNLLGTDTKATYLNTSITNENWGLLSVDSGKNCTLTAVNCDLKHTGTSGYGTYAIGNTTEHLLGNDWDVATYASILWGAALIHYGDSSPAAVKALNDSASLGLSARDIASVRTRRTRINSKRFGFMWQSTGPLVIDGGTQVTTKETVFLSKAAASSVTVDGSKGARLTPANGVLYQLMDNDNAGKVVVSGYPWTANYTASYTQPTAAAVKSTSFDPTTAQSADAKGTFTDISLKGDFYNGVLGGGVGSLQGKNLVLDFTRSTVEGVISASTAVHNVSTINKANFDQLGVVNNTPSAVVNNGVIVTLGSGSTWTVTGTSYLSSLTLASDAAVKAPRGKKVTLTVDGTATEIKAGSAYTGAVTLTVA